MSIRVSDSRKFCVLLSTTAVFLALSTLVAISAPPAAAQSRVIQKWLATVKEPQPANELQLVNDATANSSGGVTVAGDLCLAVDSSGYCSNLEFAIESYNSSGQKMWGSFIGSAGKQATATDVIKDSAGDIYGLGWEQNANGTRSMMLVKYSPSGTREWIRYFGYYQNSIVYQFTPAAIAVDAQDDVYALGYYTGYEQSNTIVLLKYSPSGTLLWNNSFFDADRLGINAWPVAMILDKQDDTYVAFSNGQNPGDTIKYDPNGNIVWQYPQYPGEQPDADTRQSIGLDSSGNVYEEGTYFDPTNEHQRAFATKIDSAGNLLWSIQIPGDNCSGNNYGWGATVAVDRLGNSYLSSTNCSGQLLVTKFDTSGNVVWQKTYTGTLTSIPVATFLNGEDDFYVLANVPSVNTNSSSNLDFLTLKYDGSGNLLWTTRFSGTSNTSSSEPAAMAASGGDLFVAGSTGGSFTTPTQWATIDYVQDAADAAPTSLTFSSQVIDTTSSAQTVTLKNTATQDLDIRGIDTSGPFSETNNCSSVIVSGGSCTIQVRFTPTSTGAQTGSLSISDQWAGSPDVVKLSGTGIQ